MRGKYTSSFKEAMIQKMSGPNARSATSLAEETGVSQTTLSSWLRRYGTMDKGRILMSEKKKPANWPADEKYQMVLQYEALADEQEKGRFLREHGLYSIDIERWREEMLEALNHKTSSKDPKNQRIKKLERELDRKEKALAETAALLALKKKADAIWGEQEEEE